MYSDIRSRIGLKDAILLGRWRFEGRMELERSGADERMGVYGKVHTSDSGDHTISSTGEVRDFIRVKNYGLDNGQKPNKLETSRRLSLAGRGAKGIRKMMVAERMSFRDQVR